jgi:hypothetical protein
MSDIAHTKMREGFFTLAGCVSRSGRNSGVPHGKPKRLDIAAA